MATFENKKMLIFLESILKWSFLYFLMITHFSCQKFVNEETVSRSILCFKIRNLFYGLISFRSNFQSI